MRMSTVGGSAPVELTTGSAANSIELSLIGCSPGRPSIRRPGKQEYISRRTTELSGA